MSTMHRTPNGRCGQSTCSAVRPNSRGGKEVQIVLRQIYFHPFENLESSSKLRTNNVLRRSFIFCGDPEQTKRAPAWDTEVSPPAPCRPQGPLSSTPGHPRCAGKGRAAGRQKHALHPMLLRCLRKGCQCQQQRLRCPVLFLPLLLFRALLLGLWLLVKG